MALADKTHLTPSLHPIHLLRKKKIETVRVQQMGRALCSEVEIRGTGLMSKNIVPMLFNLTKFHC